MTVTKKQPWPTKKAMQQIYDLNLWGGEGDEFYSGLGSHDQKIVKPYLDAVQNFLDSFDEKKTIIDLGCGDFNVGKELLPYSKAYVGVDIVPELIDRNRTRFDQQGLSFECLDIAKEKLPPGDVVILRQVLQHLSNEEVKRVVGKLGQYDYLILTEHLPSGDFKPNQDIISGQGIRLKKNSGLDLTCAPFELKHKAVELLVSTPYPSNKGVVNTYLFQMQR